VASLAATYRRGRAEAGARLRARAVRATAPNAVRVLTYHGLVERKSDPHLERNFHTIDQFRAHLEILRSYDVIPPEAVLDAGGGGGKVRVAITFDDGYKNNEIAAGLLDQYGYPWGLYPSTGLIGSDRTIWTVEVALLLLHGRLRTIEVAENRFELGSRPEREAAFRSVRTWLKSLGAPERRTAMDQIYLQFEPGEVQRLLDQFPSFGILDWEELEALSTGRCAVGSHGVSHELLHDQQTQSQIESETRRSRVEIQRRLGCACAAYVYPNGDHSARARLATAEAGYLLAFTTEDGVVDGSTDPYSIPRLTARGVDKDFARSLLLGRSMGF